MENNHTINTQELFLRYFSDRQEFEMLCRDNCHDTYEIIYALSPLGSCVVEGGEYILETRTVLFIPPLAYHTYNVRNNTECKGYSLLFSRTNLTESVLSMLDKIVDKEKENGKLFSRNFASDLLLDVFRRFDEANCLPEVERKAFLSMLASEAIIILSAGEGQIISHTEHELGARVARYLNSKIEKNVSLDKLATRFFVSKYHLCRAFKKYTGTSVHSYINHKRIMYAKQLIESGESASLAAERVGFGDYSAFYRAYVRIVGSAPTKK